MQPLVMEAPANLAATVHHGIQWTSKIARSVHCVHDTCVAMSRKGVLHHLQNLSGVVYTLVEAIHPGLASLSGSPEQLGFLQTI